MTSHETSHNSHQSKDIYRYCAYRWYIYNVLQLGQLYSASFVHVLHASGPPKFHMQACTKGQDNMEWLATCPTKDENNYSFTKKRWCPFLFTLENFLFLLFLIILNSFSFLVFVKAKEREKASKHLTKGEKYKQYRDDHDAQIS